MKVLNRNFMKSSDDAQVESSGLKAELERDNLAQDAREARVGFEHFKDGEDRLGWLMNMSQVRGDNDKKSPSPYGHDSWNLKP